MDQATLEVIAAVVSGAGFLGAALLALKMRFSHKERIAQAAHPDLAALSEAVEHLGAELRGLREENDELQERIDFAERLLTRGDERRQPTPV